MFVVLQYLMNTIELKLHMDFDLVVVVVTGQEGKEVAEANDNRI
jgi:hypothetical protein